MPPAAQQRMKIALTNHPCCAGTESRAACGKGVSSVFCEAVGLGDPTYAVMRAIFKGKTA